MSRQIGRMVQNASGLAYPVYEGWNWPCFFFGAFWYLAKGMWGIGLVWIVVAIFTGSGLHWLGILIMPALANRHYREHLATRGFVTTPD